MRMWIKVGAQGQEVASETSTFGLKCRRRDRAQARNVRRNQYAPRSWLHPEEMGTLGRCIFILASTQRARAWRDHIGNSLRERVRN